MLGCKTHHPLLHKEKMVQKCLKLFMLFGVTALSLSPVVALSQGMPQMTQEQAEGFAKMIYRKDITAGKFTQKQAGAYYKCTEDDYAQKYMNSPEGKKHMELLGHMKQMSASEKAEMNAVGKTLEEFRSQSQDKCVKQLGLKAKPQ
jgi:hypothetical protein